MAQHHAHPTGTMAVNFLSQLPLERGTKNPDLSSAPTVNARHRADRAGAYRQPGPFYHSRHVANAFGPNQSTDPSRPRRR